MRVPVRVTMTRAVALAALALLGAGVLLPWVEQPQFRVYVLGTASGLERPWVKRLALLTALGAVATLATFAVSVRRTVLPTLLAAVGLLAVTVAAFTSPLDGRWTPAIGVYVTLLGGLLALTTHSSIASKPSARPRIAPKTRTVH